MGSENNDSTVPMAALTVSSMAAALGSVVIELSKVGMMIKPPGDALAAKAELTQKATIRKRACIAFSSVFQQLPGDHQALDLARAFTYRAELHVAIKFLDRVVLDEPVPAVYLDRFVGDPNRRFRGEQFGHGRFARHPLARIDHLRRPVSQQAR